MIMDTLCALNPVYEDDHLLVLNKPSGLVVMARNLAVQRALSTLFAERQVDKRYMAVVAGLPQPATIPEHIDTMPQDGHRWSLIDLPMISDWERRPLQRVDHAIGKPSQTWWRAVTE